jgi:hypothetical protein
LIRDSRNFFRDNLRREFGKKCRGSAALRANESPSSGRNQKNSLYFPCLQGIWEVETGSYLTAHTTTQSLQTTRFQRNAKQGVSARISGHSVPGFWSLVAFARLNDDFWRFVSASKNSVPGGRG